MKSFIKLNESGLTSNDTNPIIDAMVEDQPQAKPLMSLSGKEITDIRGKITAADPSMRISTFEKAAILIKRTEEPEEKRKFSIGARMISAVIRTGRFDFEMVESVVAYQEGPTEEDLRFEINWKKT